MRAQNAVLAVHPIGSRSSGNDNLLNRANGLYISARNGHHSLANFDRYIA
jgi:hypothetical protein